MFTTARYFIKTSLAFLFLGLLAGVWMSVDFNLLGHAVSPDVVSAHTHVVLVGSVMMMIMGVALWFFPRPATGDTKYSPDLIRAVYWTMTVSTIVRFAAQIAVAYVEKQEIRWVITASSAAQLVGFGLFFYSMWGRIRAVGSAEREAKGEKF